MIIILIVEPLSGAIIESVRHLSFCKKWGMFCFGVVGVFFGGGGGGGGV